VQNEKFGKSEKEKITQRIKTAKIAIFFLQIESLQTYTTTTGPTDYVER